MAMKELLRTLHLLEVLD